MWGCTGTAAVITLCQYMLMWKQSTSCNHLIPASQSLIVGMLRSTGHWPLLDDIQWSAVGWLSQKKANQKARSDAAGTTMVKKLNRSWESLRQVLQCCFTFRSLLILTSSKVCRQTRCRSFSLTPFPTCCSFFWSFSTALSGCQVTVSDQRWVLSCQTPNFLWTGSPLWLMFLWRCSRRRTGRWEGSGEWQHGSY